MQNSLLFSTVLSLTGLPIISDLPPGSRRLTQELPKSRSSKALSTPLSGPTSACVTG